MPIERHTWVSITAGGALVCALAPLLPLLSIAPWSTAFVNAPLAALLLTAVTLLATRRRQARWPKLLARLALAVVAVWTLLFVAFGLALAFG